jgi:hypothetical protein
VTETLKSLVCVLLFVRSNDLNVNSLFSISYLLYVAIDDLIERLFSSKIMRHVILLYRPYAFLVIDVFQSIRIDGLGRQRALLILIISMLFFY